jgi:hypothetical protein
MGNYTGAAHDHLVLPGSVLLVWEQEHAFRLLGRAVPSPVPVRLLIDTGSRRCTLLPSVIAHLNPEIMGTARIETSVATMDTNLFWVRLEFPGTSLAPIPELVVARAPLPASLRAFHGVIGRDLLRRWEVFLYRGRLERFTIRDQRAGLFGWFLR